MDFPKFGKIISPLLLYLLALLLYFNFRGINDFDATQWNWYLGSFLMFFTPFFLLFWLIVRYRKITDKPKKISVFLLSCIPGLFPASFIAYGFWQMGHGKNLVALTFTTLELGLPSAIIFGLIGLMFDLVLNRIKFRKQVK